MPSVYGTKLLTPKEIGYTRLGSFATTTPRELDAAINHLKTEGARVIVLDVRGNHGGRRIIASERGLEDPGPNLRDLVQREALVLDA